LGEHGAHFVSGERYSDGAHLRVFGVDDALGQDSADGD
jgi:hypothetical protein